MLQEIVLGNDEQFESHALLYRTRISVLPPVHTRYGVMLLGAFE